MDLSQYVKNNIIDEKTIAELLDAKDRTAIIYAVTSSIFENKEDINGGAFSRALNKPYLLAKKYERAKNLFDSMFNELVANYLLPLEKDINNQDKCAIFNIRCFHELSFDKNINSLTLLRYGDKMLINLKEIKFSVSDLKYNSSAKAICYSYEDYTMNYLPIVLD